MFVSVQNEKLIRMITDCNISRYFINSENVTDNVAYAMKENLFIIGYSIETSKDMKLQRISMLISDKTLIYMARYY